MGCSCDWDYSPSVAGSTPSLMLNWLSTLATWKRCGWEALRYKVPVYSDRKWNALIYDFIVLYVVFHLTQMYPTVWKLVYIGHIWATTKAHDDRWDEALNSLKAPS